jgi:hypothetical protein
LQKFRLQRSHIVMNPHAMVFLLTAMLILSDVRADLLNEVPQDARDELAGGQTVEKSENVPGAPWPKLKLYTVVDAPPQILIDLFADYSAAPSYNPAMLSAKVIANNADGTKMWNIR